MDRDAFSSNLGQRKTLSPSEQSRALRNNVENCVKIDLIADGMGNKQVTGNVMENREVCFERVVEKLIKRVNQVIVLGPDMD